MDTLFRLPKWLKNLFIPPSRKGYFCSSISDRKSRFYPQVSKSRFYPLVNKVNLNLEHRMNKREAAVMAADDRNCWSLAVVPTWRSKVVEETNSIFKIWCGNIKSRLRWESRVRSSGVRLRCLGLTWIPRFRIFNFIPSFLSGINTWTSSLRYGLRFTPRILSIASEFNTPPLERNLLLFLKISDSLLFFYLFYLFCAVFVSCHIVMLCQTKIKISNWILVYLITCFNLKNILFYNNV